MLTAAFVKKLRKTQTPLPETVSTISSFIPKPATNSQEISYDSSSKSISETTLSKSPYPLETDQNHSETSLMMSSQNYTETSSVMSTSYYAETLSSLIERTHIFENKSSNNSPNSFLTSQTFPALSLNTSYSLQEIPTVFQEIPSRKSDRYFSVNNQITQQLLINSTTSTDNGQVENTTPDITTIKLNCEGWTVVQTEETSSSTKNHMMEGTFSSTSNMPLKDITERPKNIILDEISSNSRSSMPEELFSNTENLILDTLSSSIKSTLPEEISMSDSTSLITGIYIHLLS